MFFPPYANELNEYRRAIVDGFIANYKKYGYQEVQPLPVTSKEDESVIFIGAAVSALKKDYVLPMNIPETGLVLAQDSIRTRNIRNMLNDEVNPKWGSYFTNIDTVRPYEGRDDAVFQALDFFKNTVGLADDELLLRVNTQDEELMRIVALTGHPTVEYDAHPEKYYRHTIGIEGVYGENFNFAVKNRKSGEFSDVGNFIIFKDKATKEPLFLEVGFGDTAIMQQTCGLPHILDCYPFPNHEALNTNYKFKDCIITSLAMMREGLEPSSKDEQTKILYKYLRGLHYFANKSGLRIEETSKLVYHSENMIFGDVKAHQKIIDLFKTKEQRITELNTATIMALKKQRGE